MESARRHCKNKPAVFCYICGEYTVVPNRNPVIGFIKCAYRAYFGIKLGDQDWFGRHTWFARHAPRICVVGSRVRRVVWSLEFLWFGENRQSMSLTATSALLMWLALTEKNRNSLKYPDLESARADYGIYFDRTRILQSGKFSWLL